MQTPTTNSHPSADSGSTGSNQPAESCVATDPGRRMIGEGASPKAKKREEKWRRRAFILLGIGGAAKGISRCLLKEHKEKKAREYRQNARDFMPRTQEEQLQEMLGESPEAQAYRDLLESARRRRELEQQIRAQQAAGEM